jgi:hypothetical protein
MYAVEKGKKSQQQDNHSPKVIQPSTPQSVDLPASAAVVPIALPIVSPAPSRHSANAPDQADTLSAFRPHVWEPIVTSVAPP